MIGYQLYAFWKAELEKENVMRDFEFLIVSTGWTNVNHLYFSDSIEIGSLQGSMLCCPEINQSKQPLAW